MANQTQDLEDKAWEVLDVIRRHGVDWVRDSQAHNPHLTYSLEKGLFDQSAVGDADVRYRQNKAWEVLDVIGRQGVDWVRDSQAHNPHLTYGLEHGLFKQADVDTAQKRYKASRRK